MKLPSLLAIAIGAATIFTACQNDSSNAKDAAAETTAVPASDPASTAMSPVQTGEQAMPAAPTTIQTEPPQNAAGVWHYTCPKGCAGGAGAAVPCAKCGTTLVHNAAYHPTPTTTTAPGSPAGAPGQPPVTMPKPAKDEPPQNAAGVWHYTCAAGCPGGAGAAIACAKCGKTLVHNTAYHNK